ncbi:NADP-dependent oxidoreductase domain-containing protein [Diaporthe sp. PMI_573]|nr:NADP-dependent oxidoreductase domain-containing protein [Diaporthaceae sp. PMI_573]
MLKPVNQRKAKLNDENEIPVIGLGTFLSAPNEVTHAVVIAWLCGVRHFDCAQFYQNEEEVGAALKLLSQRPDFRREDIFITSKAWNSHHRPENIKKALDQSLRDLGTTYLDLYLIHWTVNFSAIEYKDSPTGIKLEPHEDGTMLLDKELSLTDTWRTMIELRSTGKVKSIGVSNFRPNQIQKLIDETGVTPAVSQGKLSPNSGLVSASSLIRPQSRLTRTPYNAGQALVQALSPYCRS